MVTTPDSAYPLAYQGDEALAGLLKRHQAHVNLGALTDILPGILAAPDGEMPNAWMDLVADSPNQDLIAQLEAFRKSHQARLGQTTLQPIASRLALLREALRRQGLDGFIIGRADDHQGEYVP